MIFWSTILHPEEILCYTATNLSTHESQYASKIGLKVLYEKLSTTYRFLAAII